MVYHFQLFWSLYRDSTKRLATSPFQEKEICTWRSAVLSKIIRLSNSRVVKQRTASLSPKPGSLNDTTLPHGLLDQQKAAPFAFYLYDWVSYKAHDSTVFQIWPAKAASPRVVREHVQGLTTMLLIEDRLQSKINYANHAECLWSQALRKFLFKIIFIFAASVYKNNNHWKKI